MTVFNLEEFKQLVKKQLSGISTADEDRFIEETCLRNPSARQAYDQLSDFFNNPALQDYLRDHDPEAAIEKIIQKKRVLPKWAKAAAAALVITCIALAAKYLLQEPVGREKVITLKLANGKELDLSASGTGRTINIDDAQLQADSAILNLTMKGPGVASGFNRITVPPGMSYTVVLADSTVVYLNSGTAIEFPFSFPGKTREVKIQGEAFLEVSRNTGQPFFVQLPQSTIQVLGTTFNVNSYDPSLTKVALVTGALKIKSRIQEVVIRPGQQAIYQDKDTIAVSLFNENAVLGWRKGVYIFQNEKLEHLIPVISRWFGAEMVFDDKAVGAMPFWGVVEKKKGIESFLDDMAATGKMEWYKDSQSYHLRSTKNPPKEFQKTTLEELITEASKIYEQPMIIDNPATGKRGFTGIIDPRIALDTFLANLQYTHDIQFYKVGDTLHLK